MSSLNKSPEQKRLERLTRNPNEAVVGGRRTCRWDYCYRSITDVKDFGMHSRKIRRRKC